MGIIWTILVGLIIGAIAKFLMPGKGPGGFIITIFLGIVGSVLATYIGQAVGWYMFGEPAGFLASVLGAMFILFVYRLVMREKL